MSSKILEFITRLGDGAQWGKHICSLEIYMFNVSLWLEGKILLEEKIDWILYFNNLPKHTTNLFHVEIIVQKNINFGRTYIHSLI